MSDVDNIAARYRPRTFRDVAGASSAVAVLQASAAAGTPTAQLLLSGGSGVGKTTLARVYAAALFCPAPADGNPCGTCPSCESITGSTPNHPDVTEVDAAAHGGVDSVRTFAHTVALVPVVGPWRVHIIDEAHGLTKEGAGAFLRLLEEPPPHAVFILATTDPHKLPPAVRGRCLHLPVTTATDEQKVINLRRVCAGQKWTVTDDVLTAVVDVTDPELGVRATLHALSTAAGATTTPGAYAVLGAAPSRSVAAFFDAVTSRQVHDAAARIHVMLDAYSAVTLSSQLRAFSRRKLRHALGGPAQDETVRWLRLWSVFAQCDGTDTGLLLATTAALRPEVSGVDALADLIAEANSATQRLSHVLAQVPSGDELVAAGQVSVFAGPDEFLDGLDDIDPDTLAQAQVDEPVTAAQAQQPARATQPGARTHKPTKPQPEPTPEPGPGLTKTPEPTADPHSGPAAPAAGADSTTIPDPQDEPDLSSTPSAAGGQAGAVVYTFSPEDLTQLAARTARGAVLAHRAVTVETPTGLAVQASEQDYPLASLAAAHLSEIVERDVYAHLVR